MLHWQGFSTSANFEMKDKAEMKAYLSLIENSLVPSEVMWRFCHK